MRTTRYVSKLFLMVCMFSLALVAMAQEAALKEAEAAYTTEDYAKAIEL